MNSKKVLITGGTKGLGRSLADLFIGNKYEVFLTTRNGLTSSEGNKRFKILKLNLAEIESVSSFGDKFIENYGVPDALINNAGYGAFFEWGNFDTTQIIEQTNVLFLAPSILCKKFVPAMADVQKGTVINITSLATIYPLPYMPIYNSCKSALSSLTQSLALEYPNFPRFMDFRLGDIKTNFNKSSIKQDALSQPEKMRLCWKQIEKQLNESPSPEIVAGNIFKEYSKGKHGVFYGGGIIQSRIAPLFRLFLTQKGLRFLLQKRYFT